MPCFSIKPIKSASVKSGGGLVSPSSICCNRNYDNKFVCMSCSKENTSGFHLIIEVKDLLEYVITWMVTGLKDRSLFRRLLVTKLLLMLNLDLIRFANLKVLSCFSIGKTLMTCNK